ncbi:MAG: nickel pincer cofactor biosynthesis protein LarC [Oscillospiraceae bacterium]|nr:nickel pincer cofactor biosynthesis protein LarC [Oscillospiraceae bacterium]
MKILYLDCGMGAAGDMLTAALLALVDDKEAFLRKINGILDGKAVVSCAPDVKCGVQGLHVSVVIGGDEEGEEPRHHHPHTGIREIRDFLASAPVSEKVRADALAVFNSIAEAEAAVHGREIENIHFHELGTVDAVADVLGVCLLMEQLAPDRVLASPVNVGGGAVKCAHGVLPVPAPATERLLRGIPYYEGEIKTELCTPTGAALLRHFVSDFGPMPTMRVENTGYGTGKKEFGRLNAVRAVLGEAEGETESLVQLACNLDDSTGEELGFALEELFKAGALDAWTAPIGMKKGRPAVLLCCLCRETEREAVLRCLFQNTATLGVRETRCARHTLERSVTVKRSAYGDVRIKTARGFGAERSKAEYEDLARLAREHGVSLRQVKDSIE